jgi:hypothetical protein
VRKKCSEVCGRGARIQTCGLGMDGEVGHGCGYEGSVQTQHPTQFFNGIKWTILGALLAACGVILGLLGSVGTPVAIEITVIKDQVCRAAGGFLGCT